jgi:hypothetical protein
MSNKLLLGLVSTAMAASMVGCSGMPTSSQSKLTAQEASHTDRHVQAIFQKETFVQIYKTLPERINDEDRGKLMTIDPTKVAKGSPSMVSAIGPSLLPRDFGKFGFSGDFKNFTDFKFFKHGDFYFPYMHHFRHYHPFNKKNYFPYFYNNRGTYYPYNYTF